MKNDCLGTVKPSVYKAATHRFLDISDEKVVYRYTFLVQLDYEKMNSKLFAICVILMVASVISLSQGNAVNTHFDQIGKTNSVFYFCFFFNGKSN